MTHQTSSRPQMINPLLKRPELLAPAGDPTCLTAAIQGGCDAVYFGVSRLNMRSAGAENFCVEGIPDVCATCHERGIRAYLTLNTIVYEDELPEVEQVLRAARGHVDAVICWDPAVIGVCREFGMPLHVSTQASIANTRSLDFYKQLGAERVILARELTLEEVQQIKRRTDLEIEAFVHGAMCVSVSGRCFLSHEVYGKSGNRGECYHNCRREYLVKETQDGYEFVVGQDYVLSAKDLCTIPFIEKLVEAGIDSFKIEGRNRNPEYVRTVVGCYRQALDACMAGTLDDALKEELVARVRTVYNRDFSDGFYMGRPVGDYVAGTGNQATVSKQYVGRVLTYYKKVQVVEIEVQSYVFGKGDTLMVQGATTGVVTFQPDEIRQDELPVDRVERGVATVRLTTRVRDTDKVYVLVPNEPKERL